MTEHVENAGLSRNATRATGAMSVGLNGHERGHSGEDRATELIHFTMKSDVSTPYGVPRWIQQTPSVVGSRKAEEHNIEFFDRGGVPPFLIIVEGGTLAPATTRALKDLLQGKSREKLEAAVLEVVSTGTIGKESKVTVKVERFGSSDKDFHFEKYDKRTEAHVRKLFRLPPIFLGLCHSADTEYLTEVGWR